MINNTREAIMEKFGKTVVRQKIPILIIALLLLIPSVIGYINTRTNYDILTYLPKDIAGVDIAALRKRKSELVKGLAFV